MVVSDSESEDNVQIADLMKQQLESNSRKRPVEDNCCHVHTIFCIDNSGSMRKNQKKQECFKAIGSLIREQLAAQSNDNIHFTLISFNLEATVHFTCRPLSDKLLDMVQAIEKKLVPERGTTYACAFQKSKEIINGLEAHSSSDEALYHLVFLSDGRPGDLAQQLPVMGNEQTTFKSHHRKYESAPKILKDLVKRYKDRITFFPIAIGALAEAKWLERLNDLARHYGGLGQFIFSQNIVMKEAKEDEDDDVVVILNPKKNRVPVFDLTTCTSTTQTKSIREAFSIVSCHLTQTTQSMSQRSKKLCVRDVKLERTVEIPTQSLTTSETSETEFCGQRLLLKSNRDPPAFVAQKGDHIIRLRNRPFAQGAERNVYHLFEDFDDSPTTQSFSQFGQQAQSSIGKTTHFVAKESRLVEHYTDRLKFHMPQALALEKSSELAKIFNRTVRRCAELSNQSIPAIEFVPSFIYRIEDDDVPGGFRYLSCEPYLEGAYIKYNGNNGYVLEENLDNNVAETIKDEFINHTSNMHNSNGSTSGGNNRVLNLTAQAFSHWTYHNSISYGDKQALLVCDIQGVGSSFTDPSICTFTKGNDGSSPTSVTASATSLFGKTDVGKCGVTNFFSTHRCNFICHALNLKDSVVY